MTVTDIHKLYIQGTENAICDRTFRRWVEKGSKLAAVAWGGGQGAFQPCACYTRFANFTSPPCVGSVYLLLLIGACKLKGGLMDAPGQFAWQVASVLRDPDPGMITILCCTGKDQ